MIFNAINTNLVFVINVLSIAVGGITLTVYYKQRKFVNSKAYRRERGLVVTQMTIILEILITVFSILSLVSGHQQILNSKEACVAILAFEIYTLLAVFSWSFNDAIIANSIAKLRMIPFLKFKDMFFIGYLLPIPFVATLVLTAVLKDGILQGRIHDGIYSNQSSSKATNKVNHCSISNSMFGQLLVSLTFILPITFYTSYSLYQLIRISCMQWDTWNRLSVEKTVKVRMHQFKSRYGLQRTILLVNMKIMLIMAATGTVFVNPAYKDIFKEIFSICLASLMIVIFINSCVICDKETNPFMLIEAWWRSTSINKRMMEARSIERQKSASLATVLQISALQPERVGLPSPDLSHGLAERRL